jgi:hypothetical protein
MRWIVDQVVQLVRVFFQVEEVAAEIVQPVVIDVGKGWTWLAESLYMTVDWECAAVLVRGQWVA